MPNINLKKVKIMKKLLLASLLALSVTAANAATHRPGYYVKGEVGASIFSDKTFKKLLGSTSPVFGLGVGYKLHDMFRTELNLRYKKSSKSDVTYNSTTFSKIKLEQFSFLLNGYYDFHNSTMVTPYVTAGLGYGNVKTSSTTGGIKTSKSKGAVAWNIGLGSKAQLAKEVDVDLSYKFSGAQVKFTDIDNKKPYAHEITLGLIYNL